MKLSIKHLVAVVVLAFFSLQVSAQSQKQHIASLRWLAGCWRSDDPFKDRHISEQWMMPLGGTMLGMGRTVSGGRTVDYEFLRIEEGAEGIMFYAQPNANKDETAFKLVRLTTREVTFENPDHDFPQRVIYRLKGTHLTGRIEGNDNGKFVGIDFPMIRAKCVQ